MSPAAACCETDDRKAGRWGSLAAKGCSSAEEVNQAFAHKAIPGAFEGQGENLQRFIDQTQRMDVADAAGRCHGRQLRQRADLV